MSRPDSGPDVKVGLLTGGQDPHYSHGLTFALAAKGVEVDFVGSDELDSPALRALAGVRFLNLRGSQERSASTLEKVRRVSLYYWRLIQYAMASKAPVFHILWNNKIEVLDRTLLMLWYRLCGRRVVFTAHNVNSRRRDGTDTFVNRLTLKIQYRLCDQIFAHTEKMKQELIDQFGVRSDRVTLILYGINNIVPASDLTPEAAKALLGVPEKAKTILAFGNIGYYKGLDYLVTAFEQLAANGQEYRLIIAGKPKPGATEYWDSVRTSLEPHVQQSRAIVHDRHIPDPETEVYFKAADVLVLPYREIFQSGVLFLGCSFGLPVVAADVGSLSDDVIEDKTGFLFRPHDPMDLARTLERYFTSPLFADLQQNRRCIRDYVTSRHSWDDVGDLTRGVYAQFGPAENQPGSRLSRA